MGTSLIRIEKISTFAFLPWIRWVPQQFEFIYFRSRIRQLLLGSQVDCLQESVIIKAQK